MAFTGQYVSVPQFGQPTLFRQQNPAAPIPQIKVNKHLTCRYWFYSRDGCPDSEEDCPYAHIDTKYLSPYGTQRGTCWHWKYAMEGCRPPDGTPCKFEHRETGVENDAPPRTGQDRRWHAHKLTGINLSIANAAEKAGFNVADKKALMELVFAVRRAGGLGDYYPPKPRHPLYPDKYRPGGKRARDEDYQKVEVVGMIGGHAITTGTANNPINVEDDADTHDAGPQRPNSSAKRQKMVPKMENAHPVRLNMVSRGGNPQQQISRRRRRRQASPPRRRPTRSVSPRGDGFEDTDSALRTVGEYLTKNLERIGDCGRIMSDLWGADARFQRQDVIPILKELKYHFDESAKWTDGATVDLNHVTRIMRATDTR